MIYGYIRISTDRQSVENQRFEIIQFCLRQGVEVDKWIEEIVSGKEDLEKRKLGYLLSSVMAKNDVLICAELSRLGRNLLMIMSILHTCMRIGIQVWTIKDNYRLGNDMTSKVLAFAFGLSAEIERELISQRTKEALARRKAEGGSLGRPKGRRTAGHKLSGRELEIAKLKEMNVAKSDIARAYGVHRSTVYRLGGRDDLME